MEKGITWVAMDTSKKFHVASILYPEASEPREVTVQNETTAIERFGRKLRRESSGEIRCCYEAGPCGFALQRQLKLAVPGIVCDVIAPALVPVRPGDRIKTDRRDARKLVRLYRAGELTVVHPATEEEEAVRDLLRCRESVRADLLRSRHRLSKFLLRRAIIYRDGIPWTKRHATWLNGLTWNHEADRDVFWSYRLGIQQLEEHVRTLDERIETISQGDPYKKPVGWLRCLRGVGTITAMTVVTELRDLRRFSDARALMSFLGLVPSEHSSGERSRRGGLTKAGNSHVRRVVMEAAWHYHHLPNITQTLQSRREGQPAWAIAIADRAMSRLSRRYLRLCARGKPHNKVIGAIGRELVGFIWGMLQEGQRQQLIETNPTSSAQATLEETRAGQTTAA